MELEEMKLLWQQQQQALQYNQKSNDQLIRHLLGSRAQNKLGRMLGYEYLSLALCSLILLMLILYTGRLEFTPEISITYPFCLLLILAGLIWGVYKIRAFQQLDITRQSVTETRQRIIRIRLFFHRELQWSFLLMPLMVISGVSVVHFMIYGHSVLDQLALFRFRVPISIGAAWIVLYFIYKRLYQPAFQSLLRDLEEIRDFE